MAAETGKPAPDFTLVAHDKTNVTLSEKRDKNVVLLFFPFAFTGTCTTELCTVRDDIGSYNDLDAHVFGISVDSPHTLAKFREVQNLNFPLLSDFNKQVAPAYGAWHEEFGLGLKGVAKRAVFVIDKQGVVRHKEVLDAPGNLPDFDAIKAALKALKG